MTVHIIAEKHGGADKVAKQVGVPLDEVKGIVERSRGLKKLLTQVDCPVLSYAQENLGGSSFAEELRREYRTIQQMRGGERVA